MENMTAEHKALLGLFEQMGRNRDVLREVLEFCEQPHAASEIEEHIADRQAHNTSVYDAASLCVMLQRAGGLDCEVCADETEGTVPEVEVVDGMEYLRPKKPATRLWHTTQVAREVLAEYDPQGALRELLADAGDYLPIYLRVLDLCAHEGGAATKQLSDAVDRDPVVQSPRRFVQFFTERLEAAGALAWTGTWTLTRAGAAYLAKGGC